MRVPLILLVTASISWAQQTSPFQDDKTGILFERYYDTTGFSFGIVAPEAGGSDFVGQLVMPTVNASGYCGISLTGQMVGSLLITAWPSGSSVMSSFRETSGYTSPLVYSNASLSLSSIANGTFVNSTHMSYTFLCSNCLGFSYSFDSSTAVPTIGWALGSGDVSNAVSSSSAAFTYHSAGFGVFGLNFTNAQSVDYPNYASMATISNSTVSGNSTSSTCSGSTTNITATVSNTTYDYIIAGAGPAGIIVAQRLAESGQAVLLLDRGSASTYVQGGRSTVSWNETVTQYDVPSMSYYLTTASDTSEYCTDTASMAGCILGGGTMVNALMFVRPQAKDFDDKWPTGWKWTDVESSAASLYERNPGTTLASSDGKRYDQAVYNILAPFLDSIGYSHVDAVLSPDSKTRAYSYPPWDIQDGLRAGPVKSYLPLAQAMSNFKLTLDTQVIRVVRNGSAISGVEVADSAGNRQIININTGGKVVLASGTMSTPRILFNSGIGPRDQINIVKNGCTSVSLPDESQWIDLPVGQNLKDHPIFTLTFNTTMNSSATTSMLETAFTSPNVTDINLFAKGSGPLAQSGQRLNFWTSLETNNGTRFFQGTCSAPADGQIRIKLYLTHGATSSGVLGITSEGATEFTTQPLMNTEEDKSAVTTMIDSFLNAVKNSTVLRLADSTISGTSLVSADSYTSGSHFVGTTVMGSTDDGFAVVDTDTKVFGTDNLFVVDASIHPDLPTGNTQAIVMVVAEHAAIKIRGTTSNNETIAIAASSNSSTLLSNLPMAPYPNTTVSFAQAEQATVGLSPSVSAVNNNSSLTTLTVKTTLQKTITSCAASITDCPSRRNLSTEVTVLTETIDLATTVLPVSLVQSANAAVMGSYGASDISSIAISQALRASSVPIMTGQSLPATADTASVTGSAGDVSAITSAAYEESQLTMTVDVTEVRTVYSCAASITNCPERPSASTSAMLVTSVYQVETVVPSPAASVISSSLVASGTPKSPASPAKSGSETINVNAQSGVVQSSQSILTVDVTQIYTIYASAGNMVTDSVGVVQSTGAVVMTSAFQVTTLVPASKAESISSMIASGSIPLASPTGVDQSDNSPAGNNGVESISNSLPAQIQPADSATITGTNQAPRVSDSANQSSGAIPPYGAGNTTAGSVSTNQSSPLDDTPMTITVAYTQLETITSCAASITNCPASRNTSQMIVTRTHQMTTIVASGDVPYISSAISASGTNFSPLNVVTTRAGSAIPSNVLPETAVSGGAAPGVNSPGTNNYPTQTGSLVNMPMASGQTDNSLNSATTAGGATGLDSSFSTFDSENSPIRASQTGNVVDSALPTGGSVESSSSFSTFDSENSPIRASQTGNAVDSALPTGGSVESSSSFSTFDSENSPIRASQTGGTAASQITTLTVPITQLVSSTVAASTSGTVTHRASVVIVTETIDLLTTVCPIAEATQAASAVQSSYSVSATNYVSIVAPVATAIPSSSALPSAMSSVLSGLDSVSSSLSSGSDTSSAANTTSTEDSSSSGDTAGSSSSMSELIAWLKAWIAKNEGSDSSTTTSSTAKVKRGRYARALLA